MTKPAPSPLDDHDLPLVLDASVLINLMATEIMEEILTVLGRPVVVEPRTLREVQQNPKDGSPAEKILAPLTTKRLLLVEEMNDSAIETFLGLTGATPPDDLNDGEAATVAHALTRQAAAVIDERKAARICRERFPELPVHSTMQILSSACLRAHMGENGVTEAIYLALRIARMRVPADFDDWVRDLLGPERVEQCPSLKQR